MIAFPRRQFLRVYLSVTDDNGKIVEMQPINLLDYTYEGGYARVDQVVNGNLAWQNIDQTHCGALAQLFCYYQFGYERDLLTVYSSAKVSPAGSV